MVITSAPVPSSGDVIQVVRRVVGQLEPEQLESVDPVAKAWLSGDLDKRRLRLSGGGGGVGAGVEEYLLAELLFPIVSGAFGNVLGTVAVEPKRFKWKKQQPPLPAATEGEAAGASALPPLTGEQAEELRAACVQHARAMGMSAARAAVLADAIIGSMTR
jgi:hypothetical protein